MPSKHEMVTSWRVWNKLVPDTEQEIWRNLSRSERALALSEALNSRPRFEALVAELATAFSITPWEFLASVLEAGLSGISSSKIRTEFALSDNYGTGAKYIVRASAYYDRNADGKLTYSAEGTVEWFTTSGHYVRIEVRRYLDDCNPLIVTGVSVGNDASERFYPEVREICKNLSIKSDSD